MICCFNSLSTLEIRFGLFADMRVGFELAAMRSSTRTCLQSGLHWARLLGALEQLSR